MDMDTAALPLAVDMDMDMAARRLAGDMAELRTRAAAEEGLARKNSLPERVAAFSPTNPLPREVEPMGHQPSAPLPHQAPPKASSMPKPP